MVSKYIQSILGDLSLLHMYTTDKDIFIVSVLDLIIEFQECSGKDVVSASDEEFAKFLHDKVREEILLGDRNEKS